MNNEDLIFYGISPHYDPFRIVNCHVCNKIISLTFFHDHLVKKHEMCLVNNIKNENNNNGEEEIVKIVDEDDEVASINDNPQQQVKSCKTPNKKVNGIITPKPTITPSPSTSTESQASSKKFVTKVNGSSCGSSSSGGSQSKVFDPDRHCGVAANGSKPCMRSLTCKKHPILLKRQVEGRSKSFNDLFKKFRDEKIQQHQSSSGNVEVKLEDIKPSSSSVVTVLPPPTPPPSTSQFETKSESTIDSPSSTSPPLPTPLDESTLVYDYDDYDSYFQQPKPIAVCTYGARYLDYEATNYLVWNHREDNFRSMLSCAFDENLMPTSSSSSSFSEVVQTTPKQQAQPASTTTPRGRKPKNNLKPIVITLPAIKVEDEIFKPQLQPKPQQQKIAIKRSNSLNTKVSNKTAKIEPSTPLLSSPIILSTSSPQQQQQQQMLQTITMTPTKAFILPNTSKTPTPTNIKFIQSVPKSTTQLTPIITTNGVKRTLITSNGKKPQTIIPKTSTIITAATPSPLQQQQQQQPTITKTTKISPKTSEYIILNGNHPTSPMLNGSVINKLTLISTPTSSSVVTTPTKSINLIQTPSTIKITKRCIDSISPSPSNDSYLATTTTTTPGSTSFSSPKYIKLSHNSTGVLNTTTSSSATNTPSTLILTPIATMSPQTASNTTTTVLKTPTIAKLKIPLTTNIRNK